MKKILNTAERFVDDSLQGIVLAHGDQLMFADNERAVVRKDAKSRRKVAIVTGGGYGHLPVFLGYVGKGLCDGVAVGNVFTSPSSEAIVSAAKATESGEGVLFLFGNYMGDTMNFEMAAELLDFDGIRSTIVKGSDDVASAAKEEWESRRGVAGIFFPYKLAGACAERGADLDAVTEIALKACRNVATLGFAMSSCQLPGTEKPIFEIGEDDMELGMGIHGEPGIERTTMMCSEELAKTIFVRLSSDLGLTPGERVAVLVNGLGGTSREELYVLYKDLYKELEDHDIAVQKVYVGEYATSLEMQGASVSLLRLDEELKELLAEPACSPFIRE